MLLPMRLHRRPDVDGSAGGGATPVVESAPVVATETPAVEPVATPAAPTVPSGVRLEQAIDVLLKQPTAAPTGEATPPATPATEAAAPAEAPATPAPETPAASPLVVELPPREADGEPIRLTVETPEQAEAVNRLRNGYARREQVARERAAIESQVQAMESFKARLERDPIGFLTESIPEALQSQVLQVLVARLYESQRETIDSLTVDEAARERALRQAVETRQSWQREYDEQAEVRTYQRAIHGAVAALVPETASAKDEQAFVTFATTYLSNVLRTTDEPVTPDTVPVLLADYRARFFGEAPSASAPATPPAPASASSGAAVPAPAVAPVAPPAATPKVVPLTPAQLHARAAAAAIVPAGAGASPSTLEKPPSGMRLEQAIDWYQQRAKVAAS